MRLRCAAIALAILGGSSAPTQVEPAEAADAAGTCQAAIERTGYHVARQLLRFADQCAAIGNTASISTCLASAELDAMLGRLRERWTNTTASVCSTTDPVSELGYLPTCAVAPSSCTFASPGLDAPGPNNDLLDCLACKIRESMTGAAVRLYADQPVQNTCHQAIGSRGTWYLRRMLRRLRRCQKHGDSISLAECLSEPSTAMRSDLDVASWRSSSVETCGATNPITSSPGYPTYCADVAPEFPGYCPDSALPCRFNGSTVLNNPANPQDDLLDCLTCHALESMLEVGRDLYGANLCCVAGDCGTVRTRSACRRAGGSPARYKIETLDAGPVAGPHGIAMGNDGTLYIADSGYDRVKTVSPGGQVNILAYVPGWPSGISVSPAGDVYVSLRCDNEVLHVTQTGTVSIFAGTGTAGHSGDGGPATAAKIIASNRPAADAAGNVYLTESGFLSIVCGTTPTPSERVRMVDPGGTIHTIAGTTVYGSSGVGGPALDATFGIPYALGFAADGTLFIGEAGINRVTRIDAGGNLVHIAGQPMNVYGAYFGDGGIATQARFYEACGVSQGPDGMLFVADMMTNRIRLVDRLGSIISVAGTGLANSAPNDGGPGLQGDAGCPEDVAVAPDGRVYFSSLTANAIRVLTLESY